MKPQRYFPGPKGHEGIVVVPMTDFNVRSDFPSDILEEIMASTAEIRKIFREHMFGHGNKISANLRKDIDEETGKPLLSMSGGPTLTKHVRVSLPLPETDMVREKNPQTVEDLFECFCEIWRGGNGSNVISNKVKLAQAGIGAATHEVFTPTDRYLTPWLDRETRMNDANNRFPIHTLDDMEKDRIGIQLPFRDGDNIELYTINRLQPATIDAMRPHGTTLDKCEHVIVSEGLDAILNKIQSRTIQIFNPTSALHIESALQALQRKQRNGKSDMVFINEDEMDLWIQVMENRLTGAAICGDNKAAFPMPFNGREIDKNAVAISTISHQRYIRIIEPDETSHITNPMSVSCGKGGGQEFFQCDGQFFIGCSTIPDAAGTEKLLQFLGNPPGLSINIRNVMGAGDAVFTAATLAKLYSPLEEIILSRQPSINSEKQKIAAMAFIAILKRTFGAIAYHTNQRNITDVPAEAFPKLFDSILDKAIAASDALTVLAKGPQRVYQDPEWGIAFTAWEID